MERIITAAGIENFAWQLKGSALDELPDNFIPIISLTRDEFNSFMKNFYILSNGESAPTKLDSNGINTYLSQSGIKFKIIIE